MHFDFTYRVKCLSTVFQLIIWNSGQQYFVQIWNCAIYSWCNMGKTLLDSANFLHYVSLLLPYPVSLLFRLCPYMHWFLLPKTFLLHVLSFTSCVFQAQNSVKIDNTANSHNRTVYTAPPVIKGKFGFIFRPWLLPKASNKMYITLARLTIVPLGGRWCSQLV